MEEKDIKQATVYLDISEKPDEYTPDLETPPEGKVWRRKSDGFIIYSSITLGTLFYMNGKMLDIPIKEKPEDYELVDIESFLKLPDQF